MIAWKKQGAAFIGETALAGDKQANVVVVGDPKNEKGAVVLVAGQGNAPQVLPVSAILEQLHPWALIDILCMQERGFGQRGLPPPKGF